ncbi:MAG: GNAT family N-acetyltransferase [Azonexus sp.]
MNQIESCHSIEALLKEGYALDEFAATNNIEVSVEWFELLEKHVYSNDSGIRYYFDVKEARPSTILPLRLTQKGIVKIITSLSNYYTSLFTPLLSRNSELLSLRNILSTACNDHGKAHVMRFDPMDPESAAYKGLMNELRAIGWIPFGFFCFGNWYIDINDNWEGYLKTRSANLRSTLKRMVRKFTTDGGSFEIATGPENIEQAIAAFQDVYSTSWKSPEPYTAFIPSLIRLLASNGMLRLGIARLKGTPIGAQLWIVGQGKASIYKVAYNENFAEYSPGTILTGFLMQHVIEQDQVKNVDFLIGDDKYKKIWMDNRRERWGIVAYNRRTLIGLALSAKEGSKRIAKLVMNKFKQGFLQSKKSGLSH